jgi:hypothetical protein
MPEPDFKEQLESTANLALSAELKADHDVIMFLNDPRHSAPSLSSALADLVPNAEEAAGAILERRGKLGAFTQYSDLNDIAGLDPKALNALMQSGLQPEWLEKSAPSTSVKVSLAFLSTLYAGALWWGPLLPSFKWGKNPWLGGASVGDLGTCYDLKQSIYDKRIKPAENEVKGLEAKLEKLEKKQQSPENDKRIDAVEKQLAKADNELAEASKPLQKLKDYADAGDKEHAWWIIRSNVLDFIKHLKMDLDVQKKLKAEALAAGNQDDANKAQKAIDGLIPSIKNWQDSVAETDAKVKAKAP